jgi:hypothetical protein
MYLDYHNEPERLIGSRVRATGVGGVHNRIKCRQPPTRIPPLEVWTMVIAWFGDSAYASIRQVIVVRVAGM